MSELGLEPGVSHQNVTRCLGTFCWQRRPPQAHDVGKRRARNLYDDGRHPPQLQRHRERTRYVVGVRCDLFPVYAHLRDIGELYSLVLRSRNPPSTCTSERDGSGDIIELVLGTYTPSYPL